MDVDDVVAVIETDKVTVCWIEFFRYICTVFSRILFFRWISNLLTKEY